MAKQDGLNKRQQEQAEALRRNLQLRKAQGQARRSVNTEKPQPDCEKQGSEALSSPAQGGKTVQ